MVGLDIAVVATVCLSSAYGWWKGIVRAIIGIVGVLAGIMLAGAFYRDLALRLWPDGGALTQVAAYAIILIGILISAAIVAGLLSRIIHMTPLGIVDRALGLTAGLLIAVLAWALLLTIALAVIPGADAALADSAVGYRLVRLLASIRGSPATEGVA
jgi:membrane protein required for colicin V production